MTLDDHGPHASPQLYIRKSAPRYAALCAPHSVPGPWGARVYPMEPRQIHPLASQALRILQDVIEAETPFDVNGHVDEVFLQSSQAVGSWDNSMRGEVAVAALAALVGDRPSARYEIIVDPSYGKTWDLFIAKCDRLQVHEPNAGGATIVYLTDKIEDVRFFLAGRGWVLGAISSLTIILRTSATVAAVFCGVEGDRFYFIDTVGRFDEKIANVAKANGLEVVFDTGDSEIEVGAAEYYLRLEEWISGGAQGLPRSW